MKYPNIDLIQSFICFVDEKSLSKAASKLNVTQPGLSMKLKRFEESFESPIFEFQGKNKKLTLFGESVYSRMKDLLQKYEQFFQDIDRKFSSSVNQCIKVGCRRELITMVAQTIKFDGEIDFYPMSSEDSIKYLIDNRIDLAISRYKPNSTEISAKLFFSSHSHIVIHKNW
ncbi:MAG: LysR family transcriptional regulator, partial [Bdellovibrionaceae bacterium]|nr:LysR family transcriptional regulator [Pseudobdellovibrionaceae bacterium]